MLYLLILYLIFFILSRDIFRRRFTLFSPTLKSENILYEDYYVSGDLGYEDSNQLRGILEVVITKDEIWIKTWVLLINFYPSYNHRILYSDIYKIIVKEKRVIIKFKTKKDEVIYMNLKIRQIERFSIFPQFLSIYQRYSTNLQVLLKSKPETWSIIIKDDLKNLDYYTLYTLFFFFCLIFKNSNFKIQSLIFVFN